MAGLQLKRGDTLPALVCTLTDGETPVNLTAATSIRVLLRRGLASAPLAVNRTVTGTPEGVITMPWQPADTATAGTLYGEVEVTWPGGAVQTFPPDRVFRVEINEDLGP